MINLQLGEMANQRGVSINSIVKDAVDQWLKHQQSKVTRKPAYFVCRLVTTIFRNFG
jgi:hypothetical protein